MKYDALMKFYEPFIKDAGYKHIEAGAYCIIDSLFIFTSAIVHALQKIELTGEEIQAIILQESKDNKTSFLINTYDEWDIYKKLFAQHSTEISELVHSSNEPIVIYSTFFNKCQEKDMCNICKIIKNNAPKRVA